MRVALIINPVWSTMTPPLGLAYIVAAVEAAGHEVKVIDFNVRCRKKFRTHPQGDYIWYPAHQHLFLRPEMLANFVYPYLHKEILDLADELVAWKPDVLGFSIYQPSLLFTRHIAQVIKTLMPEVKVVFGGPGANRHDFDFFQEFDQGHLDAAVLGEGEVTIVDLLNRWNSGQPLAGCLGIAHRSSSGQVVYEPPRPLMDFKSPALGPSFEKFNLADYEYQLLPISLSRGCVAKCNFCDETRFWKKFRSRDANNIFSELVFLSQKFKVVSFEFNDSLVNGNFRVLEELVDLIIASGQPFRWGGFARIDRRMTKAFLSKLARSGCQYLRYGFESGSQKVVDLMDKRTTIQVARENIRHSHEAGIEVILQVLVGFPGESEVDFQDTLSFLEENLPYLTNVYPSEMLISPYIPVAQDPERFHVARDKPLIGRLWETSDGENTPEIRKERIRRVEQLISQFPLRRENWKKKIEYVIPR